uniref:Helicase ATP-binding domain-containing protein n=1 Tax=Aegilops tauschii subsp. strangulata TaxID=200361 RepID=A0A452Y6X8_AEGTS
SVIFGRKPCFVSERKSQGQRARETPNPPHQRALDEMPPPPPPRQDFPAFPFATYPIQTEFMSFLYSALSSGPRALALLESPTGTGKTLSIICSALQWLLDHRDAASLGHPERANGSAPAAVGGEDDEPDWMRDFTLQPLPPKKDIRKKSETHPSRRHGTKKVGGSEKSEGIRENDDEEEFLLDEYESDDGEGTGRQAGKRAHCGGASIVVVVVVVRARMMRTKRRPLPRCISPAVRIRRSRSLSASSKGRISQGSSGQCAWGPERACVLTRMFRSSGAQPGSTRGAWNCSRTRRAAKLS